MKLSAKHLELLIEQGFEVMNDSGVTLFYDNVTQEAYHKKRAVSMARHRKKAAARAAAETEDSGLVIVGVREGTLAAEIASGFFTADQFRDMDKDPKGTDMELLVFHVPPKDWELFIETYMEISGRNKLNEQQSEGDRGIAIGDSGGNEPGAASDAIDNEWGWPADDRSGGEPPEAGMAGLGWLSHPD